MATKKVAAKRPYSKSVTAPAEPVKPRKRRVPVETEPVVITSEQFKTAVDAVKSAFDSLHRIEHAVRDNAPQPASVSDDLRIKEIISNSSPNPSGPGSVEQLIAQVNQRSRQVLGMAEALRRQVRNEPTAPDGSNAACESHGQLKDFLLGTLNMLGELEYNLDSLASYLLG
jgi:hypothetical protein